MDRSAISSAIRAVLTCDVKESRAFEAAEWRALQGTIKETLADVNNCFRAELLREFSITLDDEFQGVLTSPELSYAVVIQLQDLIPVEFRCGIGIGTIELLAPEITEMRGEAFFRSRAALERAKKAGCAILVQSSDAENDLKDETVNTLLGLISTIRSTWSARQKEIVRFYRAHEQPTYSAIARDLGVSKQAISKVINAAHWSVVQKGEQIIQRLLKELGTRQGEVCSSKPILVDKRK
jgi:predicted DNA-binding protein YlxM (UPF0122 family)